MQKKPFVTVILGTILILFNWGCSPTGQDLETAFQSIKAEELSKNVEILASDEFEGRFPASRGEERTLQFLEEKFLQIGLKPGNGESFRQAVPLVKITAGAEASLSITGGQEHLHFRYAKDFVAVTRRVADEVVVADSEMVFVGYGIIASEYSWDDYAGIDVRGKTVLMLINDPGFTTEDPALFNGRAMTYYGRWTYKYEEAARRGAAGALIIHETAPAAYGWDVVENGWTGPQFNLISEDNNMGRCAVEGWMTQETSEKVLDTAGLNLQELKTAALDRSFKAIPLGLKASLTLKNCIEQCTSNNFVALLPGSGRTEEVIIYMAHWDHFGIDPTLEGDQVYNGALDNATGTAGLIELAEAFMAARPRPARSILFLAVTGEEQGLLGSAYYAAHPLFPRPKTVAVINMDSLNIYGKMGDITVIGYGQSELDDYVLTAAAEQGRIVRPDPQPQKGSFYRSDHFPFAKQGIPSLYCTAGIDHVVHGKDWTLAQRDKYIVEKYHKPTDEYDPNWDLSGAVEDLQLLFKLGYRLSLESTFPGWKEGSEFKSVRDAEMRATKR